MLLLTPQPITVERSDSTVETKHAWATTPPPHMSRRNFITKNARDVRNLDF